MTTAPAALRASDEEREQAVALLRTHCQHGRLSIDELAARLSVALAARTRGELDALLDDLPAQRPPRRRRSARRHLSRFLLVNGLLIVIWLLSGAGYFWPIWPLLGWGIGVAAHLRQGERFGRLV